MKISKSAFKNLSRCPRYYGFYKNDVDSLDNHEDIEDLVEDSHIDIDPGDYDINQLDVMNDYYKAVELEASKASLRQFGGTIIDATTFEGQKKFSAKLGSYELYSFADIVNTTENSINIIEVKSCTNRRFNELGPKIDGEIYSIFQRDDNIYTLKGETASYYPIPDEKYNSNYRKLFDKYNDIGKYVYDLAIQRFIIEHSSSYNNEKTHKYYLAILNKDYIFDGAYIDGRPVYNEISNQNVINFVELTEVTRLMQNDIRTDFDIIKKYIYEEDKTFHTLGKYCYRNNIRECKYLKDCLIYLNQEDIIADLSGISYKQISSFYDENKVYIKDLEPKDITKDIHKIEVNAVLNDKEWIDKENISKELSQLEYPIYHLDFETFSSPLPRFSGESPSSVFVFQFSIHIERSPGICDENEDHYEFLAKDHNDYRETIADKLVEIIDLSKGGTVIAWHKSFEKSRIKELSEAVPHFAKELMKIHDYIYDLKEMFKGRSGTSIFAYRKQMKGSFSIKYVLPAYTNISYNDMSIGNGLLAQAAYATVPKLNTEQKKKLLDDLTLYCKQDTWAMVELLQVCRNLIID